MSPPPTVWFTSDQHYGHGNVIRFCDRPFKSVGEMNDAMIGRHNESVKPEDTVYILGDLIFDRPKFGQEKVSRLQGKKILVRGNHDRWTDKQYLDAGINLVLREALITVAGINVRLSHWPQPEGAKEPRLCGHVHEKWKELGNNFNVGVDVNYFKPVNQSTVEAWLNRNNEKKWEV